MVLKNFIVLEGIDGAGTTTQLTALKELYPEAFFTAEPTALETGCLLRRMLKGDTKVSNKTASYMFAADRCEHIEGRVQVEGNTLIAGVRAACEGGKIVISDRYLFSSLAYQGAGGDRALVSHLNKPFPLPELLFYFEIKPEAALERISARSGHEIYEKLGFLKKTSAEYDRILSEYESAAVGQGMRIVRLDAALPKDAITAEIARKIGAAPAK